MNSLHIRELNIAVFHHTSKSLTPKPSETDLWMHQHNEYIQKALHFQNMFIFNEASKFYHHVLKVRLYKFDNFLFNFLEIDNLLDGFGHRLKFRFIEAFFSGRITRAVWIGFL